MRRPVGFLENAGGAWIFAILGGILRGSGTFLRPILPGFIMFPLRVGGGPSPEGISAQLRLETVLIRGDP